MFKGSNVALITPFKNDKLDVDSYIKLIHFHMENGTNGLVPAGTTGESPTLSHDEHQKVIDLCIKESKGKLPLIAGTGSNSTDEAIDLSKFAETLLPLLSSNSKEAKKDAIECLELFPNCFEEEWLNNMRKKISLL